jgi:hypothetical protein
VRDGEDGLGRERGKERTSMRLPHLRDLIMHVFARAVVKQHTDTVLNSHQHRFTTHSSFPPQRPNVPTPTILPPRTNSPVKKYSGGKRRWDEEKPRW